MCLDRNLRNLGYGVAVECAIGIATVRTCRPLILFVLDVCRFTVRLSEETRRGSDEALLGTFNETS